jgi:hypothetical protein
MKSKVLQRKMFRDPSEDENVGIMQGFMDSLEEMLTGEGDMSEEEEDSPSGAPDRTPRSPEILMNTMRGDMRSVDARVEELADMVGYNAASSTPLEVLALLQPVLKQQGIAALPTSSAMPPSPAMAPPPSTSVPPVPTQGGGIATLPQGDMGQGPPPMPMQMARGGVVQNFAEGDEVEAGAVTNSSYPPEVIAAMRERIVSQMSESPAVLPDLMKRTQELAPQYRTLIGADPSASKGQMLFDVAQAALNYAGNVNAQGQQMRGSQAARLAGAFSGLPAAIGARAAEAQKQNQGIRLAAMQGAQSEIDAVRAANISRQDTLDKIAIESMKNQKTFQPMTQQQKLDRGYKGADLDLPWLLGSDGSVTLPGGRPSAPLVNMGSNKLSDRLNFLGGDQLGISYTAANSAMSTLNNINQIRPILNVKDSVYNGPISGAQVFVSRLANSIGVGGKTDQETLNNTVATMQNLALFELDAAAAMRGQGAITENERALIKRASAGDLAIMTQDEVITLVNGLEKQANYRIAQHNARLGNFKKTYADDPEALQALSLYDLTDVPIMTAYPPSSSSSSPTTLPSTPTITPEAIAAEIARRNPSGQ